MAPRKTESIWDLAVQAEPLLARLRRGLPLKDGGRRPPLQIRHVRSRCPVCARQITLTLGSPRQTAPAPNTVEQLFVSTLFAGFPITPAIPHYVQ